MSDILMKGTEPIGQVCDYNGSVTSWTPVNASVVQTNRNIYKISGGLLHLWFSFNLSNALADGVEVDVVSSIEATFGVTVEGNAHTMSGVVANNDKQYRFTCINGKIIVRAYNGGLSTSDVISGYLAIPISN